MKKNKNWTLKKLFNCKISCIGILSVQFNHKNNIIRYLQKRFLGFTAEKRNSNMGLFCLLTRYCIFVEHCTKYHLKYKRKYHVWKNWTFVIAKIHKFIFKYQRTLIMNWKVTIINFDEINYLILTQNILPELIYHITTKCVQNNFKYIKLFVSVCLNKFPIYTSCMFNYFKIFNKYFQRKWSKFQYDFIFTSDWVVSTKISSPMLL